MELDTSYRQKRCRHGWVDGKQCEACATETQRDDFVKAIRMTLAENGHLADGDDCTLKRLKDVLAKYRATDLNEGG